MWHDGEVWRVALDTQSLEDDPDCGELANFVPLTNYRYVQSLVIVACVQRSLDRGRLMLKGRVYNIKICLKIFYLSLMVYGFCI